MEDTQKSISIDMEKSFEGLSQAVELEYPNQLLTGALFAFINKKREQMKILYWDFDGLADKLVWSQKKHGVYTL